MRIVYYANSIRPFKEHLLGFIDICNSNTDYQPYVITSRKAYPLILKLISEKRKFHIKIILETNFFEQVSVLAKADIIVGSAKGFYKQISRMFSLIYKRKIIIKLRPGKVTKASGFLETGKTRILYVLKEYLSHKLFKSFTLVTDDLDKYYCITAYGSCHESLIIHPSPKLIHLNMMFKSSADRKKILFAPTHRPRYDQSPIDTFIISEEIQKELRRLGWDLVYSCHEHGYMNPQLRESEIENFDGNWHTIGIVVTDYSSIGADFASATGLSTIYYLAVEDNYRSTMVIPEFFNLETRSCQIASNESELLEIISGVTDFPESAPLANESLSYAPKHYFEKIIAKINVSK